MTLCCPNCGSDLNLQIKRAHCGKPVDGNSGWGKFILALSAFEAGKTVIQKEVNKSLGIKLDTVWQYKTLLKSMGFITFNRGIIYITKQIPSELPFPNPQQRRAKGSDDEFYDPRKTPPFDL